MSSFKTHGFPVENFIVIVRIYRSNIGWIAIYRPSLGPVKTADNCLSSPLPAELIHPSSLGPTRTIPENTWSDELSFRTKSGRFEMWCPLYAAKRTKFGAGGYYRF